MTDHDVIVALVGFDVFVIVILLAVAVAISPLLWQQRAVSKRARDERARHVADQATDEPYHASDWDR